MLSSFMPRSSAYFANDWAATMGETAAYIREAVDVGMEAQKEGIASVKISRQELRKKVESMINNAKATHDALVKAGCIPPAVTD
jgi:hypothetical protein